MEQVLFRMQCIPPLLLAELLSLDMPPSQRTRRGSSSTWYTLGARSSQGGLRLGDAEVGDEALVHVLPPVGLIGLNHGPLARLEDDAVRPGHTHEAFRRVDLLRLHDVLAARVGRSSFLLPRP